MRYLNVTSLYFATPLVFNAPTERFPCDDLRKILHGGQRMAKVQNGEEILPNIALVGRAHERYRRQTDDRKQTDLRQQIPEPYVTQSRSGKNCMEICHRF